jgi:IS4 transposase
MLDRAKSIHPETKYVLFDSWFSAPKALLDIKAMGYDTVARIKNHKNYRYLYNGECLSISQIYKMSKKRGGKSRYLLSVSVQIRHNDYEETVPATIVFVRNKKNRKEWLAILSTDTSLSEDEIIALYGKRWDIEPFFKVRESALRLTKEFQIRSFDAIVAHAAIVLTRYIFMAVESRENKDNRSIGEIGLYLYEELEDISFQFAFELLISVIESCLSDYLLLTKDKIEDLVSFFWDSLPQYIKAKLRFSICES